MTAMSHASATASIEAAHNRFRPALRKLPYSAQSAFSLIEVALALGILAVAMVGILSLLPAGLGGYRQTMDTTISAQIFDRILSEAEASDLDTLFDDAAANAEAVPKYVDSSTGSFVALSRRYFDDAGRELTKTDSRKAKYLVHMRLSLPGAQDPGSHKDSIFTSLPQYQRPTKGTDGPRFNPRDGTMLTVQVLTLPGTRKPDEIADEILVKAGATGEDKKVPLLFSPDQAREKRLALQMRSSFLVRYSYRTTAL
jgi:uncharacterized protein (TIGR02598 family)